MNERPTESPSSQEEPTTEGGSESRRFGRGVMVSVPFIALIALLGLANNIVLARVGGPEGRGLYALMVSILALSAHPLSLGLGPASTYLVGQGRDRAQVATGGILWFGVLQVFTLSALAWSLVPPMQEQEWQPALWGALVAIPAFAMMEIGRSWHLGLHRPGLYHAAQAGLVLPLVGLNAWLVPQGLEYVIWNLAGVYWGMALLLGLDLARRGLRWPSRALRQEGAKYGLKAAGTTLADTALLRIDYLLLNYLQNVAVTGIYAIADQLSHVMAWIGLAAGRVMLAESSSDPTGDRTFATLSTAIRILTGVLILGSIAGAIILPFLIPLVFGEQFRPAYYGFLILCPAAIFKSNHALVATYLAGQNQQEPILKAGAAAIAVDVALALVLVPQIGWLGAAVAKSTAYLTQLSLSSRALRAHRPNDRLQWLPRAQDVRTLVGMVQRKLGSSRGKAA